MLTHISVLVRSTSNQSRPPAQQANSRDGQWQVSLVGGIGHACSCSMLAAMSACNNGGNIASAESTAPLICSMASYVEHALLMIACCWYKCHTCRDKCAGEQRHPVGLAGWSVLTRQPAWNCLKS
jgi:hypothetical protein